MSVEAVTVAVLGGGGLVGRELVAALREQGLPWRRVVLLEDEEGLGPDGEDIDAELQLVTSVPAAGVDLVFLCAPRPPFLEWASRAAGEGTRLVDLSGTFSDRPEVPLGIAELRGAPAPGGNDRLVAVPVAGALAVAAVLEPLLELAPLERVVVTGCEPVSEAGAAGIEELRRQTVALLSGREAESEVFAHRIAFNLIPGVGEILAGGISLLEQRIASHVRRLLEAPDLPISVATVRTPTFYGSAYCIHAEFAAPVDEEQAVEVLRRVPGVLLAGDLNPEAAGVGSGADAVGVDAVVVGRLRRDPSVSSGLVLWASIDGLRTGSALCALRLAEELLRRAGTLC